ncbi:UDP-N-acetylmuramate dehydrogenase [Candidatus Parcubacteria bacterium]|nr:MAG: UDP-N-acetylmuramate dehydrogenase [Candidatus Parcubacteria bacterium]
MKIHQDFQLAPILYYKIGGIVKCLIEAQSSQDLKEALEFINNQKISKVLVIGTGANILMTDEYFDGVVLRMLPSQESQIEDIGQGLIKAYAGENLDQVIKFAFDNSYRGLEWAGGLPGTVGAAVRGNVGAFGGEIKELIESVEVFDSKAKKLELKKLTKENLNFSYRNSLIKQNNNLIVVSVVFKLKKASPEDLENAREKYSECIEYRKKNHPLNYPNSGSVFKNIEKKEEVEKVIYVWPDIKNDIETKWHGKVSMGHCINRLGLAGYKIGDAQISYKHNNFIVNLGNAKYSDVINIIETVQQKFSTTFGFTPEVEVEIIKP